MSHTLALLLLFLVLAFACTFASIPAYIRFLYRHRLGKNIRTEALVGQATVFHELHKEKAGTPSMGAGVILLVIFGLVALSVVVQFFAPQIFAWTGWQPFRFSLWNRNETYLVLFTLATVGAIGLVDDYMNIRGIGRTKGLPARVKLVLLTLFAGLGAYWFYAKLGFSGVHVPFVGVIDIGYLYIPFFILVLVSMANSVNVTDGLDGLAGGLLLFDYAVYAFITYDRGLLLLSALCMIVVGTLIAFLWFNIRPAKFFMGDVGSLPLGAGLGVMAMMTDTIVVLLVVSGIFILEIVSVIVQIASKKLRHGKKVFRIAPFHHHLEAVGWKEETIVMRLWLVGMILAASGLVVYLAMK